MFLWMNSNTLSHISPFIYLSLIYLPNYLSLLHSVPSILIFFSPWFVCCSEESTQFSLPRFGDLGMLIKIALVAIRKENKIQVTLRIRKTKAILSFS